MFHVSCFTGSGELEFSEFVTLAAQFLVEEDAEEMQNELKEAFRLYDKEGITLFFKIYQNLNGLFISLLLLFCQITESL